MSCFVFWLSNFLHRLWECCIDKTFGKILHGLLISKWQKSGWMAWQLCRYITGSKIRQPRCSGELKCMKTDRKNLRMFNFKKSQLKENMIALFSFLLFFLCLILSVYKTQNNRFKLKEGKFWFSVGKKKLLNSKRVWQWKLYPVEMVCFSSRDVLQQILDSNLSGML